MGLYLSSFGRERQLYINAGEIRVDQVAYPALRFNATPSFDSVPFFVRVQKGDSLYLRIHNRSGYDLELVWEGAQGRGLQLPEGQSLLLPWRAVGQRCYRLFAKAEWAQYLGLSTAVLSEEAGQKNFIWHLYNALSTDWPSVKPGFKLDRTRYRPDYFSINGQRHPYAMQDSQATVRGRVGDTLYIHVVNSGFMWHSVHFHGYHVILEASNVAHGQEGWNKDSFPMRPGQWMRLRLVPHQPGMYPVHDHNLIAVTSGGNYPGGMMAHLMIMP